LDNPPCPLPGFLSPTSGTSEFSLVSNPTISPQKTPYYYNNRRKNPSNAMVDDNLHFGERNNGGPGKAVPDVFAVENYSQWLDSVFRSYLLSVAKPKDSDNNQIPAYENFPNSVISWFETLDSASGLYDLAFSESIMDSLDFDYPGSDERWVRFKPGSKILVDEMVKAVDAEKIKLDTRVKKSVQTRPRELKKLNSSLVTTQKNLSTT
jgi:hypothetical protein